MKSKERPMRRRAKPAIAKVSAKRPVAGKTQQNERSRVRQLQKQLGEALKREAEALEQQTATADILRVMSSSLAQLQPVLDAIAERGARLCDASNGTIILSDGDALRMEAHYGPLAEQIGTKLPIDRRSVSGRAFIEGHPIHVGDLSEAADFPLGRQLAARFGIRTFLAVPLVREAVPIGLITMQRTEVRSFSDKQIELVKTFADQAVIAIENVRLFTELQSSNRELTTALDQQTATSDILRVISRSQADVRPVFDAIVDSAVRLLGAFSGSLTRVAGDQIELAAFTSTDTAGDAALRAVYPQSIHSEESHARVIRARVPLNLGDVQTDPRVPEAVHAAARARGFRGAVAVPLLRHGEAIGVIGVTRLEAGGFTDDEIALLKTFADQAVIAIENARLFSELEGRNRDLTATGEILRVISSSPTDVQPVFDTIVRSAVALCEGLFSTLFQFDGELLHILAVHNTTPEALEVLHSAYPARPTRALVAGRAILDRAVVHIPDIELDPEAQQRAIARAVGWRSALIVPMLREGAPMGVITVGRAEAGPFSDSEIELLKTFADQAVIAIENVRLFKELEARNRDVTEALEQQTATSEVLKVISRSTFDLRYADRERHATLRRDAWPYLQVRRRGPPLRRLLRRDL
jgi:two-component system, NtrC family, sensor kinase